MEKYTIDPNTAVDFHTYYQRQAGSGISTGYVGDRYHVGNGLWGTVLSYLPKALKYISRFGLGGVKSFSTDVLDGKTIGDAGVNALANTAQNVINDASEKLQKYKAMRGRGRPIGSRDKSKRKSLTKLNTTTTSKRSKSKRGTPAPRKNTRRGGAAAAAAIKKVYKQKIVSSNYI